MTKLESKIREKIFDIVANHGEPQFNVDEDEVDELLALFESELKAREEELIEEFDEAIFYSEVGKGKLDKEMMTNHLKRIINELKGEGEKC